MVLNYAFVFSFFFFFGMEIVVAACWRTGLGNSQSCFDIPMAGLAGIASDSSEEVRYRSQQANSYKTSEHNHRHAKGGRKLAAARWQKEWGRK